MNAADSIFSHPSPVEVTNPTGSHPVVLVCEHASAHIPDAYGSLGLSSDALQSHIAWDPGALSVAQEMSALLDATLVHGTVSRLIYDCNRPPEAPDAMPVQSEHFEISGNQDLSQSDRTTRIDTVYRPFEAQLTDTLSERSHPIVVTLHSFTPTYHGQARSVEIGILHDTDTRLADAMLAVAQGYQIERNAPYGPTDGVTHTLRHHALPKGLLNVMIEVRNDLLTTPEACTRVAHDLAQWLSQALADLQTEGSE